MSMSTKMESGGLLRGKCYLTARSTNRFPVTRGRPRYTSKVKCFTLQPAQNAQNVCRNRIMLGLSDESDDYEQRSVVTKPKLAKSKEGVKLNRNEERSPPAVSYISVHDEKAVKSSAEVNGVIGMEDPFAWCEKQREDKIDEENSVTFYNSSAEQNEENSKAFIESLGSWINDLFNVPSKNPSLSSKPVENDRAKDSVLQDDPEYMKSISAIKEQFRKKLKSETSIQVSAPEKPFIFNFDGVLDSGKKSRRSSTSLPPTTPTDWLDEWNETEDQMIADSCDNSIRRYNPNSTVSGLIIRTNNNEECMKPSQTDVKELNGSLLVKKKKGKTRNRHDISDLEEYIFPTPSELSKRILLNVNENDKCGKFYKNSHLAVQESQHYGQRKSKAHQTNARCYTTNANDSPRTPRTTGERFSPYCTTATTTMRSTDDILRRGGIDSRKSQPRKPTKKEISDITRDSMTFLKVKTPKPVRSVQGDTAKTDGKTSSDELVRYLMKKIKTTPRHTPKNKSSVNVSQLLSGPKNRIMQSATNTLVNVMAKNDPQLPVKKFPEPRPTFPGKELVLKNDIRVDVSRAITTNKYSRLSYLLEDNRMEDDSYLLDKGSFRSVKRSQDDAQKREAKKSSNKFNKRQEVKNMLSKIDSKYTVYPAGKKPKALKAKPVEEPQNAEVREEQNARFQKQHELFRKVPQSSGSAEPETEPETKIEVQASLASPVPLSTELAVIDPNLELDDTPQENTDRTEPTIFDENTATPSEFDYKVDEFLDIVDKPATQKPEKPEKMFLKDFLKDEPKMMLSPLEKLYMSEQPQREPPKTLETPLCPAETLAQVKPADTMLLNRKYSTNTLNESGPKCKSIAWCGPGGKPTMYLAESDGKEGTGDKKEAKEKRKGKSPKMSGTRETAQENSCGFDKVRKKPGPNCEKDE